MQTYKKLIYVLCGRVKYSKRYRMFADTNKSGYMYTSYAIIFTVDAVFNLTVVKTLGNVIVCT